jgi:hypothetical protein
VLTGWVSLIELCRTGLLQAKARGVEANPSVFLSSAKISSGFEGATKPDAEGAAESRQRRDG